MERGRNLTKAAQGAGLPPVSPQYSGVPPQRQGGGLALAGLKRREAPAVSPVGPLLVRGLAATYSPACDRSTIGSAGLNFSVRNGKRWTPAT